MCIVFVSRSQYVAMGWKVRGSNPGVGENLGTRPGRPLDQPSHLYNGLRVIPWGGCGGVHESRIDHPSPSSTELKEIVCFSLFPSGPSWPVLSKLRFLTKLITCTNVVMWEYCILISIVSDVIQFTPPPPPLSLVYLAGLNTFFCPKFCIEIPTGFSCGSSWTEWMPPLVPNELCLLKLSRLSSVVACARSQESQECRLNIV